jgi:hypothetical protein
VPSIVDISFAVVSSDTSDVVVVVPFIANVPSELSTATDISTLDSTDGTLTENVTTTTTSDVPDETTVSDISTLDSTDATLTENVTTTFHQKHLMW